MTSLAAIWRDGNELVEREAARLLQECAAVPEPDRPSKAAATTPAVPLSANDNKPAIAEKPEHRARLEAIQREHGGTLRIGATGLTLFGATIDGKAGQAYIDERGACWLLTSRGSLPVDETPRRGLKATPFQLRDTSLIPQREWLFAKHYQRRYLTVTVAPGGVGKTAHGITESLCMVTGRPLFEPQTGLGQKLKVWYLNLEDPADEIERGFAAAAKHFSITADQIDDRLFTDSGRDQEFVIVRQEARDFKVCEPMIDDMLAVIRENAIDVVIVDPFVSSHEVPENDNTLVQRVAKQWRRIADEANCAIELIHHATKGNGEITADSTRGGGALKDAARSVRVINAMTKEEAEKAGLPDERGYFRIDFGKANKVPKSGSSQWRHFVSVPLGNGKGLMKRGDEVGVVEGWRWPSENSAVADVPPEALEAIKARLGAGDYRENEQSAQWAGYRIAEVLGMDPTDAVEKRRIKLMIKAWKAEGHLRVEMRSDHKGTERPHLVPGFPTTE
ncbi:AAA family ATPase [Sinorhizobium sp. 7-81]|uniref:AAA family ATPase n=1 Tax=Sinorhizobium sp. 8-89 TaxID=3049089 RepID=UPI0024C3590B|nr:AAA family ATPase [Sinorhizobium sp. 8-89]MDK1489362.1 AAA family ATPase [Sinorhizobium sp. 8-89]